MRRIADGGRETTVAAVLQRGGERWAVSVVQRAHCLTVTGTALPCHFTVAMMSRFTSGHCTELVTRIRHLSHGSVIVSSTQ